ncbi:MAG: homocysteine S-methyltransferase family protein [Gemmataceae bacterium]|nr:homocysteine S-methyltransferase family protein [Gemmataceae bacterium]
MADFLKALHSGRVLLMDGAMGTELLRAGVPRDACLEEVNLTRPGLVERIHREYAEAGADVLLTNTFQANPAHLKEYRLGDKIDDIYENASRIARAAASDDGLVVAAVGPTSPDSDERFISLARVAATIDAVLLETWSDPETAIDFSTCDWAFGSTQPPLLSFAYHRNASGRLCTYAQREVTPRECALVARHNAFGALGVNCGTDIRLPELLDILAAYRQVTDLPLFVRPNAGTPKNIDGQWIYPETPESMAAWLPELFQAGVVMVGGCCGTTPAYIAAFRKVVDDWNASHARESNP